MEPDAAEAAPSGAQKRKTHPLAPRIKRLIQSDEDVGKIAQATPHLIGMARLTAPPPPPPPGSLSGRLLVHPSANRLDLESIAQPTTSCVMQSSMRS